MITFFVGILVAFSGSAWAEEPEWIHDSVRHVRGEDILHWGTGDAATAAQAVFLAKQMAVRALVEECGGVASVQIIPRKTHVVPVTRRKYRAYAVESITFAGCEAAKAPDGKRLENPVLAREQLAYERIQQGLPVEPAPAPEPEAAAKPEAAPEPEQAEADDFEHVVFVAPQAVAAVVRPGLGCLGQVESAERRLRARANAYHGNMAAPELMADFTELSALRASCGR